MNYWYKDRDFPEIKASNADIVAVVKDPKQLQRVIDERNSLVDDFMNMRVRVLKLQRQIEKTIDIIDPDFDTGNTIKILLEYALESSKESQ